VSGDLIFALRGAPILGAARTNVGQAIVVKAGAVVVRNVPRRQSERGLLPTVEQAIEFQVTLSAPCDRTLVRAVMPIGT